MHKFIIQSIMFALIGHSSCPSTLQKLYHSSCYTLWHTLYFSSKC